LLGRLECDPFPTTSTCESTNTLFEGAAIVRASGLGPHLGNP
jgi:hypothetical protein